MSCAVYELDPDWDVEFILENPNVPFAVWDESEELPVSSSPEPPKTGDSEFLGGSLRFAFLDPGNLPEPDFERESPPTEDETTSHDTTTADDISSDSTAGEKPSTLQSVTPPPEEKVEVRMRLSAKHLILASAYFKKMLKGPWKESMTSSESYHTIDASEWDAEAMLILMNIIHGHARSVPRAISLEMLAKLAVLVDYYHCHEVVEPWADRWIRDINQPLPNQYGRDLMLCLVISVVFSQESLFETMTKIASKQSKRSLQTLNLPIPQSVIGKKREEYNSIKLTSLLEAIDQQRQERVDQIISTLHKLRLYFRKRKPCSSTCTSILLGALTMQMEAKDLLNPKPSRPFPGYSVAGVTKIVRAFTTPTWTTAGTYAYQNHMCTLADFLDPNVDSIVGGIKGLKLAQFQTAG
jgi:hypothetical protein